METLIAILAHAWLTLSRYNEKDKNRKGIKLERCSSLVLKEDNLFWDGEGGFGRVSLFLH